MCSLHSVNRVLVPRTLFPSFRSIIFGKLIIVAALQYSLSKYYSVPCSNSQENANINEPWIRSVVSFLDHLTHWLIYISILLRPFPLSLFLARPSFFRASLVRFLFSPFLSAIYSFPPWYFQPRGFSPLKCCLWLIFCSLVFSVSSTLASTTKAHSAIKFGRNKYKVPGKYELEWTFTFQPPTHQNAF